ncbi:MAG: PHP domain-containing protein [Comamonadaceae bacterium]|nr:PHP domain-containing protein [Comamonadaceae bacterium]
MTLAPNDFTHLHVHSEFSLLDGLGRIGDLVDEAERLRLRLPRPDRPRRPLRRGRLLPGRARPRGIKPIIGVETYVARRSMRDKRGQGRRPAVPPHPAGDGPRSATRTSAGSSTDAHLEGYYYKPRIDREHLAQPRARASSASSACLGGEIAEALLEATTGSWRAAWPASTASIFGKDGFFLELQDHGIPEQRGAQRAAARGWPPRRGLPLVVTNDAALPAPRGRTRRTTCCSCIGTGSNLDDAEPPAVRRRPSST